MNLHEMLLARKLVGGGVSSWNDLTDKPFGESESIVNILPNGVTYNEDLPGFMGVATAIPAVGEMYTVMFNGTNYDTIAMDIEGVGAVLGNLALVGGEATDEPFLIAFAVNEGQSMAVAMTLDGAQEASIAVYGKVKTVKKLDNIFYNAPCVYYTNTRANINENFTNYVYTDEQCTQKVTVGELRATIGRPVMIVDGECCYCASAIEIYDSYGRIDVTKVRYAGHASVAEYVVYWTGEY